MANLQDLPIDIHSGKLLDINFFHCQRIIEILRDTEKDSKNFLGFYSSQRMKDWQEIASLYKKNNVYLAEAAQILQRLVQYEIPAQKKQITKAEQVLAGHALRAELLALACDLPSFFSKITDDIIHLKEPYEYYVHFRNYIHQGKHLSGKLLPLLALLIEKGHSLTAFEFKYGISPTRIELPSYDLLLKEDEKKNDDEIDFGDEDIDFGIEDDIDFSGEDVHIDVVADTKGAVGESAAVGEDALGVVENMETQKVLKNELKELLAFLSMRSEDEKRDTSSDVFIRGFEKRPVEISKKKNDDEIDFGDEDIDFGIEDDIDFSGEDVHIDVVADTKGALLKNG
ncbi:hypothetical protein TELCIR_00762 [Teladorsagia circumcincta]|uniref:Uncharacterized protein n=1 Tax=Teladorsagia circumcincta TaxID=45464 RepID=A0A2G9V573_TELCI|nr:hypothetical protein TELCIR_00762 [Teladorsagia circumcincta]